MYTTRFWNNLHRVRSKSKGWQAKSEFEQRKVVFTLYIVIQKLVSLTKCSSIYPFYCSSNTQFGLLNVMFNYIHMYIYIYIYIQLCAINNQINLVCFTKYSNIRSAINSHLKSGQFK